MANCKQFICVKCMPSIADTLICLTHFCSMVQTRVTHILFSWTISTVLPNHTQFIPVNRMLYIAHAFIWLPVSFVPPHPKQLIELNRMPCIAHTTKIWTIFMHPPSQTFCTFFDDFLHHHLRLWHRVQFCRRVSDRSVTFGPSCSSEYCLLILEQITSI